jgi:hypothetical protein
LFGLFDEHYLGAQLFEPAAVGVEIALQGQDSDFHGELILPDVLTVPAADAPLSAELSDLSTFY